MDLLELSNKINPRADAGEVSSKPSGHRPSMIANNHEELLIKADTLSDVPNSSINEQPMTIHPADNEGNNTSGGWSPSRVIE